MTEWPSLCGHWVSCLSLKDTAADHYLPRTCEDSGPALPTPFCTVSQCKLESGALFALAAERLAALLSPLEAQLVSLVSLGEGLWSSDSSPSHGNSSVSVGLSSPACGWEPRDAARWGAQGLPPSMPATWSHDLGQALLPLGPGLLHNEAAPDHLLGPLERNLWSNKDIKGFCFILTVIYTCSQQTGQRWHCNPS